MPCCLSIFKLSTHPRVNKDTPSISKKTILRSMGDENWTWGEITLFLRIWQKTVLPQRLNNLHIQQKYFYFNCL